VAKKKKGSSESGGGAGHDSAGGMRWLLTYSDMITLLMAFFILLFSMATINASKFAATAQALREAFGGYTILDRGSSVIGEPGSTTQSAPVVPDSALKAQEASLKIAEILRQSLNPEQFSVIQTERGYLISILTDKILFDSGKANLKPDAFPLLTKIAAVLKKIDNEVYVEGHTDNVPIHTVEFPSNWELSAARAASVAKYFIEQGISPSRLVIAGYADTRPVASNDTPQGRQKNRRIDILITKK